MARNVVIVVLSGIVVGLVVATGILYKSNDDYSRAMENAKLYSKEIRRTLDAARKDGENWKRVAEENGDRAEKLEERLRGIVKGFGEGEGIFEELGKQVGEFVQATREFRRVLKQSGRGDEAP